jgi:hypothetical protein
MQQPDAAHSARPRPASKAAIRQAARQLYESAAGPPPNVTLAEQLLRSKLPGARRQLVRPVLAEPEFADQRRKAGKQPKKNRTSGGPADGMGEPADTAMLVVSTEPETHAPAETLATSANASNDIEPVGGRVP